MSNSQPQHSSRYQLLEQELNRLRDHLLPPFEPTGLYSEEEYTRTLAYRVMAHAEFEAYFEDRVREIYRSAMDALEERGIISKVITCMIAFTSVEFDEIPTTKRPTQQNQLAKWDRKTKLSGKIAKCANHMHHVLENNHGIKEENLLKLLLPIGIEVDDIDDTWLADMNSFGEERGSIAHTSGSIYRTRTLPDPKNENDKIMALLRGIADIDELIDRLAV